MNKTTSSIIGFIVGLITGIILGKFVFKNKVIGIPIFVAGLIGLLLGYSIGTKQENYMSEKDEEKKLVKSCGGSCKIED